MVQAQHGQRVRPSPPGLAGVDLGVRRVYVHACLPEVDLDVSLGLPEVDLGGHGRGSEVYRGRPGETLQEDRDALWVDSEVYSGRPETPNARALEVDL